jgi:hypothetical protein
MLTADSITRRATIRRSITISPLLMVMVTAHQHHTNTHQRTHTNTTNPRSASIGALPFALCSLLSAASGSLLPSIVARLRVSVSEELQLRQRS